MRRGEVDDRAFESLSRLVRAAGTVPVDDVVVRDSRRGFVERLGARSRAARLVGFGLLLTATAAATVGLMIAFSRAPAPSYQLSPAPITAGNAPVLSPAPIAAGNAPVLSPAPIAVGSAPVLGGGTLVRFADGSELELAADGRGRLAEVTPAGARVVLEEGALRVRVTPRPGARWIIEAGPFQVQVKGTAFRVRWDSRAARFELHMIEGTVLATGPHLTRHLHAGQHLTATPAGPLDPPSAPSTPTPPRSATLALTPASTDGPPAATPPSTTASPEAPQMRRPVSRDRVRGLRPLPGASPPAASLPTGAPPPADPPTWSRLLTRGDLAPLLAEADAEGLPHALSHRTIDDLTALATAARLSQRMDLARRVFRAQRVRFPGSDAASAAAFHLGRLADDVDRDAAGALAWFDQYLAEAPAGAFAEEALGRKMATLDRQADARARNAAHEAARVYRDRFPEGPHRDLARRLLAGP